MAPTRPSHPRDQNSNINNQPKEVNNSSSGSADKRLTTRKHSRRGRSSIARINSLYQLPNTMKNYPPPTEPSSTGTNNSSSLPNSSNRGFGNPGGRAGSGSAGGSGTGGSQYGGKHVQDLYTVLRDYMNKCDLTSYGPKPNPVPNMWTQMITNDRKTFSVIANKVIADMRNLFKSEDRMVGIASPLYVFGDIHGNFHDLRYYERELWPNGPAKAKVSFLFLGDLVDRGHHSLEVVLYLFCCKLLSRRNTFVLIRGNHELRAIQQAFTFHRECIEKLGPALGAQIWNGINKCFDNMPVAALVDSHIFCCHGGVPMSSQSVKDINNVPCPLSDPENQSPLAWELMWNDPLTNSVFGEMAELLRLQSGSRAFTALKGFLPNNKRGTAYYFSEAAALRFMDANNLSHVIRAHECLPTGYTLHSNQKLITVFSSSRYCGGNNDAACVLVEYDDVRVIRLDIGEHNAIPFPTNSSREQTS